VAAGRAAPASGAAVGGAGGCSAGGGAWSDGAVGGGGVRLRVLLEVLGAGLLRHFPPVQPEAGADVPPPRLARLPADVQVGGGGRGAVRAATGHRVSRKTLVAAQVATRHQVDGRMSGAGDGAAGRRHPRRHRVDVAAVVVTHGART